MLEIATRIVAPCQLHKTYMKTKPSLKFSCYKYGHLKTTMEINNSIQVTENHRKNM